MTRSRILFTASSVLAVVLAATSVSSLSGAGSRNAETSRRYGTTVNLGNATARAYVNVDEKSGASLEIGVALDEEALEGLPSSGSGHHGAGAMPHTYILELPTEYATPFKFVELNWNPSGHEPRGVYEGVPHFDFHFYTMTQAEREAIVPSDPQFEAKANNVPASEYVPPFNAALAPPGLPPAAVAVPKMGVHWVDVRSPELQALLGKPEAYKPFTATFIHGSWDGRVTFWEPMITRAHILAKKTAIDPAVRDQIIPIPTPARYQIPGYYPSAYRITWDAEAKEYRIALTQLAWRE
jgi:hypothetical protein